MITCKNEEEFFKQDWMPGQIYRIIIEPKSLQEISIKYEYVFTENNWRSVHIDNIEDYFYLLTKEEVHDIVWDMDCCLRKDTKG